MNQHLHSYEIPVSRNKTIPEIIEDKKAALDLATEAVNSISTQVDRLSSARDQYQKDVNDVRDGLLATIRESKQICTHFNLAEEMASTIGKLRQEAKIASDLNAKREFNNTAGAIEALLQQLR
ncbi:unnamed protein product [Rotaria socialis]|uniref:Uncharacterized protein n=1 Tax=Rotaria socialis TaxID=392032 RepID=A0A819W4M9_9BILA|nr:unnamed protein product [Rotaria socialis]CAF3241653.1 unnamed protein product [Rotaria socialis]CAF3469522.1 unnamed protein product [Rotaria socialis]CAF4120638.1 unnamed protein product [Rotaria socialis]CAF4203084.1 unnamed protein product [Rotaria socialis]